jgi:hypothetical protein
MGLREEMVQIKQEGMERAAAIWEVLENQPQPFDPANIYKACCSVKCAEFISRTLTHRLAPALMEAVMKFLDDTLVLVPSEVGSTEEGERVMDVLSLEMPLTEEIYNDPSKYATRQHVYDGLILLAAMKLGKEEETKTVLHEMQQSVARALIANYLKEAILSEAAGFDNTH